MKRFQLFIIALLVLPLWTPDLLAQANTDDGLRVIAREDGLVFVYHSMIVPLDHGINVYRISGSDTSLVNTQPLLAARDGSEFSAFTGDLYPWLRERMQGDSDDEAYYALRGDPVLREVWTYGFKEVASALGRLAVDSSAVLNSSVRYRVQIVNELGDPAGAVMEEAVVLNPQKPAAPTGLEASNTENVLLLEWNYPQSDENISDNVAQFAVYSTGVNPRLLNRRRISRNNAIDQFDFRLPINVDAGAQTFELVVRAIDITGQEGEDSEVLSYTLVDQTPPGPPSNVRSRVIQANQEVQITWPVSVEQDVVGYNVYRAGSLEDPEAFVKINQDSLDVLETYYLDAVGEDDVAYYYKVTAVDASGNESQKSAAIEGLIRDYAPPASPSGFVAEARDDGSVSLKWNASPSQDVAFYTVNRMMRKGRASYAADDYLRVTGDKHTATEVEDGLTEDSRLQEGAFYLYAVAAVDSSMNSSDSLTVEIQITDLIPPDAPRALTVEDEGGFRVVVGWNQALALDVNRYNVFRGSDAENLNFLETVSSVKQIVYDDEVEAGQTYFYAVTALDSLGNESERTVSEAFLLKDDIAPRQIRNVRVRSSEAGTLSLSWEAGPDKDLVGYEIQRSDIPTGVFETVSTELVSETSWTDNASTTGLWYRVLAVDSSGNKSKPSKASSIPIE